MGCRALLLALSVVSVAAAAEPEAPAGEEAGHQEPGVQRDLIEVDGDAAQPGLNRPVGMDAPGHADPAASVPPQALILTWDTWRTVVVIGAGVGVQRPAWVATYYRDAAVLERDPDLLAQAKRRGFDPVHFDAMPLVAYRALAFADQLGRLHIDARKAVIGGALSGARSAWIPDSFMITPPNAVLAMDDEESHQAYPGRVLERIPQDQPRFRELYAQMLLAVAGAI